MKKDKIRYAENKKNQQKSNVFKCAGFGWDGVNFLHSSLYGAKFWICAEISVHSTGTLSLPPSSAWTESRPSLLLTHPSSEEARWVHAAGRGHSRDS